MSAGQPGIYREVDWAIPHLHPREAWDHRTPAGWEGYNLRAAWREADPIDFPASHPTNYCRYHEGAGVVLIADVGFLQTVKPLDQQPETTQRYVHDQLDEEAHP